MKKGNSSKWLFKLYDLWMSVSVGFKIKLFTGVVFLSVILSLISDMFISDFAINSFSTILNDNLYTHDFQKAMEKEAESFEIYMRSGNDENKKKFEDSCADTKESLDQLAYNYEDIGRIRYATTWSIKNSYEQYSKRRDVIPEMEKNKEYVIELYEIYDMQEYIIGYAKTLVQETLTDGNRVYQSRMLYISKIPYIITAILIFILCVVWYISRLMRNAIISPVEKLVAVSKNISANIYTDDDINVENKDEIGELVSAFNKMKHATVEYIDSLEDQKGMMEHIHKEEVEKMEMEKHLNETQLELLKSQINPHFLFNTLNTIACTAKIEEAKATEQMITCLGNLFRYNLKTRDGVVPLEQELRIIKDYMYIQQKRFGSRVFYSIDCEMDSSSVMVPALILQPLVENSIIHGISKKEQGGAVYIRIWEKDNVMTISVADTGVGMDEQRFTELKQSLESGHTSKIGIGVGNIYHRINMMYEGGSFKIYSKDGCGTVVQLKIPLASEKEDETYVQSADCR